MGGTVAAVEATDPVLVGAGDVADCGTGADEATGKLLDSIPGTVFIAGDSVYEDGTAAEYSNCYEPAWGRHKARTRPAIGDHELFTPGATGYFNYFGAAAGPAPTGYYSYDLGAWHIVVLNSQCSDVPGGCGPNSPQVQWLRNDLASTAAECVAAVWHRHRFTSGARHHGYDDDYIPFWDTLSSFGADVVLNGHSHLYERFGLQDSDGKADPDGIRQFTVGTGGRSLESFGTAMPNSEFRYRGDFGGQSVLEADNSPVVESFLRFNVSGISGTVTRARLRLYATDPTGNGPALYRVDPNALWNETGITWNNKPARTGGAVANLGSISANRYVEYDVTGTVTANGTYTFNLRAESTDGADFNSKEAATNRPQLVIETG